MGKVKFVSIKACVPSVIVSIPYGKGKVMQDV